MVWLWRLCGSDNCSESQIPECKEEVAGVKKTCIMLHKVGKVGEELVTESRIGTLAICKRGHTRACNSRKLGFNKPHSAGHSRFCQCQNHSDLARRKELSDGRRESGTVCLKKSSEFVF